MSANRPEHEDSSVGGPDGAPYSVARRLVRTFLTLFVLVVGGIMIVLVGSRLPEGTEASSLFIRAGIGLFIGLVLIAVVRRMMAAFGGVPPEPPRTFDARSSDVVYVCPVCGTRVRLELASTTKAPRHCGEEMDATVASS